MSIRLYVGNLPKEAIEREALQVVFAEANEVVSTKVIKDRKTGKCRGFAFVTVATDEAADEFIEKYNGQSFMDSPLKIEKALPRAKGGSDEYGEDGETSAVSETSVETSTPVAVTAKPSKKASGGGKKQRGNRNQSTVTSSSSSSSEGFQPDPRWADKLAELKAMLVAADN